jgi:hypothetical protein
MKQIWNMTVSGGCKTFKGFELVEKFKGTEREAKQRRAKLEKEKGRIIYMALAMPQD